MAALTVTSLFIKLTNSLSEFEGCQLFGIPSRGKPRSLKVTPAFSVDSFQGSRDLLFFQVGPALQCVQSPSEQSVRKEIKTPMPVSTAKDKVHLGGFLAKNVETLIE